MMRQMLTVAALAASLATQPAVAAMVDLSPYVNSNVSGYSGGNGYPAPGQTTIGGITFTLAGFGGGTGVFTTAGDASATIAVNDTNVARVYMIVNSAVGAAGSTVGSITFTGNGTSSTVALVEGVNVRDHYCCGGYNGVSTGIYATADYNTGARFDVYEYLLPGSLNGLLDSVTFAGLNTGVPQGIPFLAAITTVNASPPGGVPEPATWGLMMMGFGAIGVTLRTRRRGVAFG